MEVNFYAFQVLHPGLIRAHHLRLCSVLSILSDHSRLALHLVVEPLSLSHVGQSYNVHFDQSNVIGDWQSRDLQRRWSNGVQLNNHTTLTGQKWTSANLPGVVNDVLA